MIFQARHTLTALFLIISVFAQAQKKLETKFEQSKGLETVTYHEGIEYYTLLAKEFSEINIQESGVTDSGHPLHLVTFSVDKDFDYSSLKGKNKKFILINNAIHPGEPDGVDAGMMLLRNLAQDKKAKAKYKDIILVVIPFYNIGGALNRNSHTRVNQNGPCSYGFRGNAQNYDPNRDFIKLDSKNAQAFTKVFHLVDPDIFVDNHVSNGADYQHIMTMLETQPDKLGGILGEYLRAEMMPRLEKEMEQKKFPMVPYVNVFDTIPDVGYEQYLDLPRYSSGYTTLFHTIGFVPETHMLKPYKDRVLATYAFMESLMNVMVQEGDKIKALRDQTKESAISQENFDIKWVLDPSASTPINFKGYEAKYIQSKVTGQKRLYYDRNKPFEKEIPFYNSYIPEKTVSKPDAYVIPQGWHQVVDRLKLNNISMQSLEKDSSIMVEVYNIQDFKTVTSPFEGHYLHYDTQVETGRTEVQFLRGDYIIPLNQEGNRYLIETLEPEAPDSFFNWNFFDTILQQKEHFSPYIFEDLAYELLAEDPGLKEEFESERAGNPEFAADGVAQLEFIYQRSPYYEKVFLRYPVYRVVY